MATYYVDPAGSDSADGLTPATAWKTIAKVNASSFAAGSSILFKAGETFSGAIVCPGSGLTFGSYNGGRATISSGAAAGFTSISQSSIVVRDLNFIGNGIATNGGNGILIENQQPGNTKLPGPSIINCAVAYYGWTGIHVSGMNGSSGFNGVLVSGCVAHDCTGNRLKSECGIAVDSDAAYGIGANGAAHTNVLITGCTAFNNTGTAGNNNWTGSGITLFESDGGVIEHCVAYNNGAHSTFGSGPVGIWLADTKNCIIQFCESHHNTTTPGTADGGGFDIDGGCQNCIIQYCYSHDNWGSGYQMYSYDDPPLLQDNGNIIRYCISENDGNPGALGGMLIGNDSSREMLACKVYNNTIYQTTNNAPCIWFYSGGNKATVDVRNNILYSAGPSTVIRNDSGNISGLTLRDNIYYASGSFSISWQGVVYTTYASWRTASGQESTNTGLTSNPLLASAGFGGTLCGDLSELVAYKLSTGSPAIDSGAVISSSGGRDFFGTVTPYGAGYDRGAHEWTSPARSPTAHVSRQSEYVRNHGTQTGIGPRYRTGNTG